MGNIAIISLLLAHYIAVTDRIKELGQSDDATDARVDLIKELSSEVLKDLVHANDALRDFNG